VLRNQKISPDTNQFPNGKPMAHEPLLTLSDNDNIAVALQKIEPGNQFSSPDLVAQSAIPSGHKIALTEIASVEEIIKYGRVIGLATQDIQRGDHVHVHNVAMAQFQRSQTYGSKAQETNFVPMPERATFQGYRRADGKVGTRNYVGIVNSVNFSASAAKHLAREAERWAGRFGDCATQAR